MSKQRPCQSNRHPYLHSFCSRHVMEGVNWHQRMKKLQFCSVTESSFTTSSLGLLEGEMNKVQFVLLNWLNMRLCIPVCFALWYDTRCKVHIYILHVPLNYPSKILNLLYSSYGFGDKVSCSSSNRDRHVFQLRRYKTRIIILERKKCQVQK